MVKMFKRGNGRLYIEYKLDGKTVQKSTGLPDTPQNRTLVKKEVIPALERKLLLGEVNRSKPKKFQHYADIFLADKQHLKTYDQIESIIKVLNERFGDMNIHKITRGDVKDFVRDDLAIDDEIIKDNPCNNIKLPSHKAKEIEPFTPKEVQILLDNAGDWMRLFLAISFYTGMRTGEVLALMHSEIDFRAKVIHIKRSINKGKLLLEKCDIPYRKVNATRHTFIVSMLKYSDLSILEVAQLAGHTNTKMIVSNYGKFIKGEHLQIDRNISIFTDKSTDSIA